MCDKKNILIVYAHQEPKSFNAAMKNTAVDILEKLGHNVEVSDLYAMKFNPVMTKDRFKGDLENPDHFVLHKELRHARLNHNLPDQVQTEIGKLTRADLLILQYPMFWVSPPAILKGYFDICFPETVGYDISIGKIFEKSDFANKRALISLTTGGGPTVFSNSGLLGDLDVLLYPWMVGHCDVHFIKELKTKGVGFQPLTLTRQMNLHFFGYQVHAPHVVYSPEKVSDVQRKESLEAWKQRLVSIFEEETVVWHKLSDFDREKGMVLTNESQDQILAETFSLTPGQNMGKPFKPGCMTSKEFL